MSLAQRRTAPEGIDTVLDDNAAENGNLQTSREFATDDDRADSDSIPHAALSIPKNDEIWRTISYDPFAQKPLQHYESFPPEIAENRAAYEVAITKRVAQVALAVLCCVLASGIVCGFAALKPILIAEGVYRSLCPADWSPPTGKDSQLPCPEQDMRLNLMFILASITLNISNMLGGWVLDNCGRRMCYILAAVILFLGSGCMAMAFQLGEKLGHFDGYIVGNLLLGLGGTFLFVSSYQLSHAFPRHSGLIVALVTGAFDASAAVFLFYRLAYEATDHAFKPAYFFAAFAVFIPLLIIMAEFTIMPKTSYVTRGEYQAAIDHAQDETRDIHDSDDEVYADRPRELKRARNRRAAKREAQLEAIETVTGNEEEREADRAAARGRQEMSGVHDAAVHDLPFARQVLTPWFWLILVLTVLQMMRMNYFIATVRAQYRYMLGGEDLAERVNSFFDVALPVAGVITTPFIGILLNEVPVWGTLSVLTVLIVVLGGLNVIPALWAGYATVVAFVIFRPLYYSAVSDYATKVFGFSTFGRIYGSITAISGVGQFIQPALDALTHGPLQDNPVPINLFFAMAGSVISAALTFFVYVKTRESGSGKGLRFGEDLADEERRALLHDGGRVEAYGSAPRQEPR
ncbi:hypothetical protein N8I77_009378 [Diaporthe amygdali]|uniref:Uncharacterized protein n=1 Tax=Phomopsis amygdali TaxID=1214568 RepID=A0AAD9S9F6_PHOAM|nr:hypothetical protein N8I77_009378 [Diaporthe amygdali]